MLLGREGHYALTDDDRDNLCAIDRLLAVAKWDHDDEDASPSRWQVVLTDIKRASRHERLMARLKTTNL